MVKQHYYQILLLLGSLLIAPLHAAEQKSQEDADYKNEEAQQHVSTKSFYTHGDLTFIDREKDKVNQKELKQGLIALSQRIKAKGRRKVYFFIGATGSGKSLSILALQGNKIKKGEEEISDDSDDSLFDNLNNEEKSHAEFEIKYVLPKNEVPDVGHTAAGQTANTFIYYPDPKQPQYQGIAFVDTEGFFGKRKATSVGKCLSAISFFYAAKANRVGGLVLVISASELDAIRGEGLRHIAHILQRYFARAVSNKIIKQSVLVMITKVAGKSGRAKALENFRRVIQLSYQEYYAEIYNKDFFKNGFKEIRKGIGKLVSSSESSEKKLEQESKKQNENRRLKLFFEMLLEQDVPEDKITNINNFKLDKKRFCFIFPWDEKSVERILDKKLKSLKPIASGDLCTFDNPLSQYMEASIRDFSIEFSKAILPLLVLRLKVDRMEKQLEGMTNEEVIERAVKRIEECIRYWHASLRAMQTDNTLEIVFRQSHYERLPANQGGWNACIELMQGYKLCKTFEYKGEEPIYKILATYGPKAELSEYHPFLNRFGGTPNKFNFIAKNFMITTRKHNSGIVTWEALAKNGKGVKKNEWILYHATTGEHKAECRITFYALKRERRATKMMIKYAEKRVKAFEEDIDGYKVKRKDYNTLESEYKMLTKKWEKQRIVQIKAWKKTAYMLQFFAKEILKGGADRRLIKKHLKNFSEATQLKSFTGNKPHPKEENANARYQPHADENQLNDHQSADNEVFDVD